MNLDRNQWINSVWSTLQGIPTGGVAAELESAWRKHQARALPVAVIFGAYDAGKSSLLKRLLFEDGIPVPPEITVSGRRETFSVDECSGAQWIFRDSPGLAGGNDEHDNKALESLNLADLLVWVLPPQLVTSNKGTFDAIVTGQRFEVGEEQVRGSLVAVITRIDEAGIDPTDNADGFHNLCKRKQKEFTDLLAAVGVPLPRWGIHTISADPYQGVGNEAPDGSLYAVGDGWDGVPGLRAALAEARGADAELRTLAGYRFASQAVAILSCEVQKEYTACGEKQATCKDQLERLQLWCAELNALRCKCKGDLHRVVEDELMSASRVGTIAVAEDLQRRLVEAIDQWSDQSYAEFNRLATSANQEADERGRSPSMEQLKRLIEEMSKAENQPPPSTDDGTVKKHLSELGRAFQDGFKAYARVDLGMSIEEAAKRVREFNESGQTWSEFIKTMKSKTFTSEAIAEKASKYVKWNDAINTFGPLVEQLSPLIFEIGTDILAAREADKKAQQRQELRDALRAAATKVEAEAMTGFDKMVATFREWLRQQEDIYQPVKCSLDAQVLELKRYENNLASLLQQRPS